MRTVPAPVKAILGVATVVLVLVSLLGYFGDYRAAKSGGGSGEATRTPEPGAKPSGDTTGSGAGKVSTGQPKPSKTTVVVQIEGLNFRAEPEAGSMVIRGLAKGERLRWLATEGGWHKVEDSEGRVGWISSNKQYSTIQQ